jgi:hypothetical protein
MKQARVAASMITAGGLLALLLNTLFGAPASPATQAPAASVQTPGPAAPAATTTPPAAPANLDSVRALRRAGLTDAAVGELRRWIAQNPTTAIPADIVDLLRELDDASLDLARGYQKVGLLDAARTALQQWMQQHPKSAVPADLAGLLPGPADNSLEIARAYKSARQLDAASAELQRWIQKHPRESVPKDLWDLLPGRPDAFQWDVRHRWMPWFIAVLEALAVVVLLGMLVIRAVGIGQPYLVVGDIDGGAITNGAVGKALSASLRQQLAEPRVARSSSSTTTGPRAASRLSLSIATGAVEPVAIPAEVTSGLGPALPLAQVFGTLLRWASPWRVVTVTGILHAPGVRGVQPRRRHARDRHGPFLFSFAPDSYDLFVPVNVASLQSAQFADAKPARVNRLKDPDIAIVDALFDWLFRRGLFCGQLLERRLQQVQHLLSGQKLRQSFFGLWHCQILHRRGCNRSASNQKFVVSAERAEAELNRCTA